MSFKDLFIELWCLTLVTIVWLSPAISLIVSTNKDFSLLIDSFSLVDIDRGVGSFLNFF